MKTININTQERIKLLVFPDQQPHVNVLDVEENDEVRVVCSITNSVLLMQLLECSNALDNLFAKKKELVIPYLLGARFDRLMQKGDSIDLKVIADLINYCGFQKVYLYDVHSDVATLLIKNAVNINNQFLVKKYSQENAVLICPDAGASKKIPKYLEWNPNFKEVVYCNKTRDVSNGRLNLKVLEPEKCEDRNCVIIDDICDGGGTFLGIASQIKPKHLALIITHGVFSKGVDILEEKFDEIIVSDSHGNNKEGQKITIVNINY